jgi:hypothetical protein
MAFDLIGEALQKRRQRIEQAFDAFCGDDPKQTRLTLRELEQLPSLEQFRLPFDDAEFDWVACFELIERLASHERQVRLLRELLRIARRGIFVSTPNREHPLLRWWQSERHLNLLDAIAIKTLVDVLPGRPAWKLGHVRLAGLKSHYFLMVWKGDARTVNGGPQPDSR